jgi:hypothetical protein
MPPTKLYRGPGRGDRNHAPARRATVALGRPQAGRPLVFRLLVGIASAGVLGLPGGSPTAPARCGPIRLHLARMWIGLSRRSSSVLQLSMSIRRISFVGHSGDQEWLSSRNRDRCRFRSRGRR